MFFNESRTIYRKNQLMNVICQLRFPTILSINAKAPYELQDAVRGEFPRYELRKEQPAPKLVNRGGTVTEERQEPVSNHNFISLDGNWKINLTSEFIALTSEGYSDWESYAAKLDLALSAFIRIYHPACFERIGLRYVNGISREALELEGTPWRELIRPEVLGLLSEEEAREEDFARCLQDAEFKVRGGCRVKLHAGPALVRQRGVQEKTPRYVLDIDVFMNAQTQPSYVTAALQCCHTNADGVFRWAITDTLHRAML